MSLQVKDMTVQFGGVTALKDVSMSVAAKEILGLVGPNGSGKSTLFNAITGMVRPIAGTIDMNGARLEQLPPFARIARGIARTFQTPRFDPHVSVEEAVMCGFYPRLTSSVFGTLVGSPSTRQEESLLQLRCGEILRDLRLIEFKDHRMNELSMGHVRLVEVARSIASDPKYILLDEPAAGLSHDEQGVLADEIRRLAEKGVGVLLVEHNFRLISSLATRIVALKEGKLLIEGTPAEVAKNREFIEAYLGSVGSA